jgi:uncharacterized protein
MKFLLWALVGVVIVMWLTRSKGNLSEDRAQNAGVANGDPEPMRQCVYCGVHLPASEALVVASGAVYCNDEHHRLHTGA